MSGRGIRQVTLPTVAGYLFQIEVEEHPHFDECLAPTKDTVTCAVG